MGVVKVEIPVDDATAAALADPRRREAVGRLVEMFVHPREDDDPLALLFDKISREAAATGLTQQDIDDELAVWKTERTARRA